jgi:acetyl-CoA carboxylase biotin carboxyl carrier protein
MSTEPTPPTWADVLDLVTGLDSGSYADVELRMPGLHLRMSTTPSTFADEPPPGASPAAADDGTAVPAEEPTTVREVVAPMLGTFYRRPSPDAPPLVEVGDTVAPDTTVAIVEVMKLMNPVTAGVAGRVVEVRAADGDLVEHGDVLFRIEPVGAP